jgi:hypothetical protein
VFGSREFQEGMKRLREQEEKLRHTPPETTYEEVGLKSMTKSLSDKIINEIKSDIFKEIEKQLKKCKKS